MVAFQLYGRKAGGALWQVGKRSHATNGICQGNHARRVLIPVDGTVVDFYGHAPGCCSIAYCQDFNAQMPMQILAAGFVNRTWSKVLQGLGSNFAHSLCFPFLVKMIRRLQTNRNLFFVQKFF